MVEQYEGDLLDADTAIKAMNAMKIGEQLAVISEAGIRELKFTHSYMLSPERKKELKSILTDMRREANEIVEKILRDKVKAENDIPGEMPVLRKKKES